MDHRCSIAPPPPMAADRLSSLPDDLLRRILYFSPMREGVATAVLFRRWPGLCIDTRSYDSTHGRDFSFEKRASSLTGAVAVLAAAASAQGPVRRLAVDVVAENPYKIYVFLHTPDCYSPVGYDMLVGVLANPVAQHVQELLVGTASSGFGAGGAHGIDYRLSFGALPSRELQLLHITNCTDLALPPPGMAFPLLTKLVLLGCTMSLGGLQGMIGAAPQLAVLHLEHTRLTRASQSQYVEEETICSEHYLLSSPTVTSLVLAKCGWPAFPEGRVTLDMSMLWCFKYHGLVHRFSLKSKAPNNMTRADLHFVHDEWHELQGVREHCKAFWRFVQNFDNAKFLKLELECPIEYIVIVTEKSRRQLLAGKLFSNLERLKLEGRHKPPATKIVAVAIKNLLQCCPVVRDLRIRLRNSAIDERSISYISLSSKGEVDWSLTSLSTTSGAEEWFCLVETLMRTMRYLTFVA